MINISRSECSSLPFEAAYSIYLPSQEGACNRNFHNVVRCTIGEMFNPQVKKLERNSFSLLCLWGQISHLTVWAPEFPH